MGSGSDLIVANLVVTPDGTVQGTEVASRSVDRMSERMTPQIAKVENKWKSMGKQFGVTGSTIRTTLVDFTQILRGLVAGFTIGSLVIGLSNVVTQTIASTDAFKDMKEAAIDLWGTLVIGEDVLERMRRKNSALGLTLGVVTSLAIRGQIDELEKWRVQLAKSIETGVSAFAAVGAGGSAILQATLAALSPFSQLASGETEPAVPFLLAGGGAMTKTINELSTMFTKLTGIGIIVERLSLTDQDLEDAANDLVRVNNKLKQLDDALNNVTKSSNKAKKALKELPQFSGPSSFTPAADVEAQVTAAQELQTALGSTLTSHVEWIDQLIAGSITFDEFNEKVQRHIELLVQMGATQEEIASTPGQQFLEGIRAQIVETDTLIGKYQAMSSVLSVMGGFMQAAADAGILSQQKAFKAFQVVLAAEATLRGLMEIAHAMANTATNPFVAGIHYAAAGLYFGVAAFRAAGAVTGGTGGGGGGVGGSQFFGEGTEPIESREARSDITVIIEGTTLFGDPEEVARALAGLLRKATADGF